MLSVPPIPQFWRTDSCFIGDLIYRAVVTSTRHGAYEDTTKQAHSLPAYHKHLQTSRKTQTQRTHIGTLVVSQQQRLWQTTNHTKRERQCYPLVIIQQHSFFQGIAFFWNVRAYLSLLHEGRNLGSSLRGLRRWPSSCLHRLVCWQKITNGREILPGRRFPRSTGILPDPNWYTERHNKSFHMKWICENLEHFSQMTSLFPCQEDSTSPPMQE